MLEDDALFATDLPLREPFERGDPGLVAREVHEREAMLRMLKNELWPSTFFCYLYWWRNAGNRAYGA